MKRFCYKLNKNPSSDTLQYIKGKNSFLLPHDRVHRLV